MTMALLPNKLKGKPLIPSKSAALLKEKLKQLLGFFIGWRRNFRRCFTLHI